jgi:hypothetical protein
MSKYTGPKLDPSIRYRLIIGQEYVTQLSPLKTSKDKAKARPLNAGYLMTTAWSWWDQCLAEKIDPNERLPDEPAKPKKGKAKGKCR